MITGQTKEGVRYAVRQGGRAAAYCALSIRCGTRDEAGYPSGIAHFTEHTVFRGTRHKSASQINSCLDRLGGELNAYTTKEEIVIHATVLKEDLRKAMDLLLELATTPTFPEEEIETERGVVLEEIISYKDSPSDDIYDRFEEALFAGHPLGTPILGTLKSVKKISTDDLKSFVKEHFIPSSMVLSVVSPMPEEKVEREIRRCTERWFPGVEGAPLEERESIPAPEVFFDKSIEKRNHETNAVIGGLAPSLYGEKERMAAILLANLLGGPASNSMLGQVLREKNGWVYGVECSYTQYADTGIMAITFGCDRPNLERCLAETDKILRKVRTDLLGPRKLKEAKKQLLGQLAISSESGETQCLSMGKSLLSFGRVLSAEESRQAIESITAEDLREAARKIFPEGKVCRLIYK